jgi:hypothetical protein
VILNDPVIKQILVNQDYTIEGGGGQFSAGAEFSAASASEMMMSDAQAAGPKDIYEFYDKLDQDDVNANSRTKVYLLEIHKDQIEVLQKR